MSSGFYVHIPFCRKACRYCDFHFSVSLAQKKEMIKAMKEEILRKLSLFGNDNFITLYFGGGTPSVLEPEELKELIDFIKGHFHFQEGFEISLEANPDDLSRDYLQEIKKAGADRLSIGVQSFHDDDLVLMRRSHNSKQAIDAIRNSKLAGFGDLNVDLIYGIPGSDLSRWKENLEIIFKEDITHISAYHLSFEQGTVFDHWRKKRRLFPVEEDISLDQFQLLKTESEKQGYVHYEISNFAKPGYFSKHNSLYWKNRNYIGIGPSAHSYNGKERFWNIRSNKRYMEILLSGGDNYYEKETLSTDDKYNEYILTSLRTMWGIDLQEIRSAFGDNYVKYTEKVIKKLSERNIFSREGEKIIIVPEFLFLSDQIIREFFRV